MSDEAALLAAIRAHPDEDTPRLAYADWLDEQGGASNEARAEYIRLSIEVTGVKGFHNIPPDVKAKQEQARKLFVKHYRDWFPEFYSRKNILRGTRGSPQMSRGFPYKLQGRSSKIIAIGERLTQLAPMTELQLLDMTTWDLERLVAASWAGGLRKIGAGGGYGSAEPNWGALANGTHFAELLDLAISFGYLDSSGGERIAAAGVFPKLERFYFGCYSDDDVPAVLFGGKTFTGLRDLDLSGGGHSVSNTPMPGLKEICESIALRSLKSFDMGWRPTPGLTAMLTSSTFWPGLKELDLLRNNLGDGDLAAMLKTPSKLCRLELPDNKVSAKGAKLLAEHPAFANFTSLDLSDNAIGDAGVAALANSPNARNLRKLELSACGFGPAGLTAIAESPHLANLRELWISRNEIDLKGARLLAASPQLANIEYLNPGRGLTATGKKALRERFGNRVRL